MDSCGLEEKKINIIVMKKSERTPIVRTFGLRFSHVIKSYQFGAFIDR